MLNDAVIKRLPFYCSTFAPPPLFFFSSGFKVSGCVLLKNKCSSLQKQLRKKVHLKLYFLLFYFCVDQNGLGVGILIIRDKDWLVGVFFFALTLGI